MTTFMPGSFLISRSSRLAMESVMCFSYVFALPTAPGSSPPCPASTTTTMSRFFLVTGLAAGLVAGFEAGFDATCVAGFVVDVDGLLGVLGVVAVVFLPVSFWLLAINSLNGSPGLLVLSRPAMTPAIGSAVSSG